MKRILFLDDSESRHRTFRAVSGGHDVTFVYTADTAIADLRRGTFDLIYLDFDLSATNDLVVHSRQTSNNGASVTLELIDMPHLAVTFPHARYQSLSEIRFLCLPLLG